MTLSSLDSAMPETVFSVTELTDYIQELLEQDDQLQQVWVIGEVSSTNSHRSGLFFSLQDSENKTSIQCVSWQSQLSKLVQQPQVGEQLIVLGHIRIYPQRGQYQLIVWQALPGGEGLQALRDRQLRNRLEADGLFDPQRKRPLPIHPQIIAVVTSPQAAAWGDIQRTLQQRYPGLQVLFSPAQVQGELAPASIVAAIERVEQDGRAELIILARGGGASEDLACFNNEQVVRAIANCSIPILTGIGHQRDESLADLVADACAHTPTAAAELAVPKLTTLITDHQQQKSDLANAITQIITTSQQRLQQLKTRLIRLPLEQQLQQEQQRSRWQRRQLIQSTSQHLNQATRHGEFLRQKLATLDPKNVLKRGYAVVRSSDGTIARSVSDLGVGETVKIQLGEGQIKVKITAIIHKNGIQ